MKIKKSNVISSNENFENENFKLKIFSQFNQTIREGCKAKKKIFLGNSSQYIRCWFSFFYSFIISCYNNINIFF